MKATGGTWPPRVVQGAGACKEKGAADGCVEVQSSGILARRAGYRSLDPLVLWLGKKKIEFKRNQNTRLEWLKSRVWLGPFLGFSCSFWKQMALEKSTFHTRFERPWASTPQKSLFKKWVAAFWFGGSGVGGSAGGALRNVRRTRPPVWCGVADQVFPGADTGAVHAADLLSPRFGARLPSLLLQSYGQRLP